MPDDRDEANNRRTGRQRSEKIGATRHRHLRKKLQSMFEQQYDRLPDYAWTFESDRWAEMVFCLLRRVKTDAALDVRAAIDVLHRLGLLSLNAPIMRSEDAKLIRRVLSAHGFSDDESATALKILQGATECVDARAEGKIQRVLRHHGELLRDDLTAALSGCGLGDAELREAVSEWLQNAACLPVSLEGEAVLEFCANENVTHQELLAAVDDLDLNIAVVDDLLAVERLRQESQDNVLIR